MVITIRIFSPRRFFESGDYVSKLPPTPFIYPLTDRALAGNRSIGKIISELADGGACIIQLREKNITTREYTEIATEAVSAAQRYGIQIIINDRVDVALYSNADGVHLGDEELPASEARTILGEDKIIGVSCHSIADVEQAKKEPIDYFAVGPIFATNTKKLKFEVVGLELIRAARKVSNLPMVAIGGIANHSVYDVVKAGADGVAVISAAMAPTGIDRLTKDLVSALLRDN